MVTPDKTEFLVSQGVITSDEAASLLAIGDRKYASAAKFTHEITVLLPGADAGKSATVISSCTRKGIPARLTTFFAALLAAVVATYTVKPGGKKSA
jgi:hypothetical protein